MTAKQSVDVYDFDKTIYNGDASLDFLRFCLRTQPGAWLAVPGQLVAAVLFALKIISRDRFKERSFAVLKRLPAPDRVVLEFWRHHRSKLAAWYLDQRQPQDVIISASPEFLLAPIAAELGIGSLIATPMDPATGTLRGRNCRGEEKVRRFVETHPGVSIDRAYSDSLTDLPILSMAKQPFVVRRGSMTPLAELTKADAPSLS